jgi:hypothetical protein
MIQEFRSKGVEESRKIAAMERVREVLPLGTLPDGVVLETTGVGDERISTEFAESFPGDEE